MSCIFSNHNSMKSEINHTHIKKKSENNTNTWKLNNMPLNNECVNQELKEEKKDTW